MDNYYNIRKLIIFISLALQVDKITSQAPVDFQSGIPFATNPTPVPSNSNPVQHNVTDYGKFNTDQYPSTERFVQNNPIAPGYPPYSLNYSPYGSLYSPYYNPQLAYQQMLASYQNIPIGNPVPSFTPSYRTLPTDTKLDIHNEHVAVNRTESKRSSGPYGNFQCPSNYGNFHSNTCPANLGQLPYSQPQLPQQTVDAYHQYQHSGIPAPQFQHNDNTQNQQFQNPSQQSTSTSESQNTQQTSENGESPTIVSSSATGGPTTTLSSLPPQITEFMDMLPEILQMQNTAGIQPPTSSSLRQMRQLRGLRKRQRYSPYFPYYYQH